MQEMNAQSKKTGKYSIKFKAPPLLVCMKNIALEGVLRQLCVLIPMYLIIGIWGSREEKVQVAFISV